ncbi:MAG TPA: diacylglycerol kinase family protein [Ktedonobacteraceae bacterium]|nr:diacylglycerol kinase family protein [Ktedonobacteraceae bacterium]
MKAKSACLIINPRSGENLAKLNDVLAVLSAAGWDADVFIKEYGGHTLELAKNAGKQKYDLVIAYGGDGTLNQVVNGVMYTNKKSSSVGLLPGGTANEWANEVGIPVDPVKSALSLINSRARRVDVGHITVEGLTFPPTAGESTSDTSSTPAASSNGAPSLKKRKTTTNARQDFLMMAGLGIDAAVMGHVSKPLKYHIGPIAVGLSAAYELPKQHPFPVEIRVTASNGEEGQAWKGEALQVVVSNTRKYADVIEMSPDAYIDDGSLDVTVITASDSITTMQQIMSLVFRRKPDSLTAEVLHGSSLHISAPASIAMQLDGTAVKLQDYLSKKDRTALKDAIDPSQVMVTYRFDAVPRSLSVAIPCSYNDALFESAEDQSNDHANGAQQADTKPTNAAGQEEQAQTSQVGEQADQEQGEQAGQSDPLAIPAPLKRGRKVRVIGASHNPDKQKPLYVIAGSAIKSSTGEFSPVAVRVNGKTTVLHRTGGAAPLDDIEKLPEGVEIAVEGKKSKRGVIVARQVVI